MRTGLMASALLAVAASPVWAVADYQELTQLRVVEAHGTRTRALTFDHTGRVLVSGGSDRKLRIFDGKTLRPRATWTAPARDRYEP